LPETIRDHLQNTVRFDYDDIGRTEEVEDPEGNITTLTYYKNDLVKTVTDPEGNITRNSYNANYMLEEFLNSLNEPTDLEYDEDTDLLISQTFGNSTRTYEWHDSGLLDVYTSPNGDDFEYRYHDNDQLESDGFLRYHYDSDSERFRPAKIHHEVESSDSLTFDEYDDIDRLVQYTQHYPDVIGGEYSVGYEFDENSNIIKLIYPNDYEVDYFYDKNDRLTKVRDWEGREFRYEWRADGLPHKIILPNGTEKWYDYDEAGRSTSQTWYRMPIQQAFLVYDLERDQRGFVDNETDPPLFADVLPEPQHINYSYTPENRIDTHTDNITGITSSFEYSPNGNCLKSHRYDFEYTKVNQLDSLHALDGSLDAQYYYSPDNKRIAATRNGTTTRYWWDNSGMGYVIGESEPDSEAAKYLYIYGLELLARIDMDTDEIHYYHSDYRGNIAALTDDDQDITHKYRYSTYGTTLNTLEADYNPFRFMGAYGVMHETDYISYVRERYLDHDNFVFLQEDPIWAENLYTYAGGNPVNYVDANGLNYETIDKYLAIHLQEQEALRAQEKAVNLCMQYSREADKELLRSLPDYALAGFGTLAVASTAAPTMGATLAATPGIATSFDNAIMHSKKSMYYTQLSLIGTSNINYSQGVLPPESRQILDNVDTAIGIYNVKNLPKNIGTYYKTVKDKTLIHNVGQLVRETDGPAFNHFKNNFQRAAVELTDNIISTFEIFQR